MRGINKSYTSTQGNNLLSSKKIAVHPRRKKYLEIKRQREIDAMVEFTRNQLMDRYDG
jgi:hypothetical protein